MEFLFPNFLWALSLLAIPIIIHLFYFRRFKKVQFTNVKFLKEIKEETSSRNKLKNLLVLLCRLLAVSALILAFAQPFIPKKDSVDYSKKSVSIFVDNSFSMSALSSEVPLIEKAKKRAREIVSAYTEADEFQIITHDFLGKHQRSVGKEDALSLIDEIQISPSVRKISQVINRQNQVLSKSTYTPVSYILSDFQNSISDFETIQDSLFEVNLIPMQDVQEKNVSIDSVWFSSPVPLPNQNNQLMVSIKNHGDSDIDNVRLTALHNGVEKPAGTNDIEARSSVVDTINLNIRKNGWHELELKITDYPVQFDDTYYLSFEVEENVNVLSINGNQSNSYLNSAFKGLRFFELENAKASNISYSEFPTYNLIILNDLNLVSSGLGSELSKFVQQGGNLLIFPGQQLNKESMNAFFEQLAIDIITQSEAETKDVSRINTSEFVFDNVYLGTQRNIKLPQSTLNYLFSKYQSRGQESLLSYRDGTPYLLKYGKGNGNIYLCASPLNKEKNDLVANAEVFVPMLYKMAISSGNRKKTSYTIGKDHLVEIDRKPSQTDFNFEIKGPSNFIPAQTNLGSKMILDTKNQIVQDGYYDLTLNNESLAKLAFNFNRIESDLNYMNESELSAIKNQAFQVISDTADGSFEQIIGDRERGVVLWKWCLIFALIFLALETILLRWWKL